LRVLPGYAEQEAVVDDSRPDPSRIESVTDLARELTLLRERAGLTVREVQKRTGIVHSTLGGYFSGRHKPALDRLELVLSACGADEPEVVEAWRDAVLRTPHPSRRRPAGGAPYRGLESYGSADADWFYGRTRLTAAVVTCILAGEARPLMVVGPSGAGKSSVLRAGVVPAFADHEGVRAVIMTPGRHPSAALEEALAEPGEGRTVLVVDQFEEVFADDVSDDERTAFVGALSAVDVVIGMRADFYARALQHPVLAAALQVNQVIVEPPGPDELREIVLAPAARAGLTVEAGLVELLLADVARRGEAGAGPLPLLSHALLATWDRGGGARMTVADYRAIGGLGGAVARSAEDAMTALEPEREEAVRALFLRLVHVTPDALVTRRQVDRDELPAAAADLLDEFVARRLVVVGPGTVELAHEALLAAWPRLQGWIEADRVGIVARRQLAEAARDWRDHDEDPDVLLRGARLVAAAERAAAPGADLNDLEQRFLGASVDVDRARTTYRHHQARRLKQLVAALAVLLLVAVGLGAYSVVQGVATGRERDVAVSRQVAVRSDALRGRDPALAAQLAVAAYRIAPTPEARSSLLNATGAPVPARLPGPAAVTESVAVDRARKVLVSTSGSRPTVQIWDVRDPGRPVRLADTPPAAGDLQSVVLSPDGRRIAAGGTAGDVVVVDLADPARPGVPVPLATGGGPVLAVAFGPGGRTLLAATGKDIRRWTLGATPTELPPLAAPPSPLQSLAVSPDGRLVAAGTADGPVALWRDAAALPPVTGPTDKAYAVAFSPDGRMLAAGSADRTVRRWDVADPARPVPAAVLTGATNWVNAVAFSPDGRSLAAGSSDGYARLYDLATSRVTATFPHPGPVTSTAFLDAGTLATGEADGVAHLWPVRSPVVSTFDDAVFAVAFAADGRRLAVGPGSKDGTAGLLDVGSPQGPEEMGTRVRNPAGDPSFSGSAALTPDGRTLAVGRSDGSVRMWDVSDPAGPVPLPSPPGAPTALVEQLTVSPDGRTLAASGDDNAVRLWDIATPTAPRAVATLTGATSLVLASAFSPDGRWLAAASADTKTYLWDLRASPPTVVATLGGPSSYAYSPAFSPDGRTLAVGSADKSVRLYDVSDPAHPAQLGSPLTGPSNYVYSVAFSPDGRTLAAASTDGTVWLWDVSLPSEPTTTATLTGPTEAVFAVAWSPDGTRIAGGSADKTVRLWSADPDRAAAMLCAGTGAPLQPVEWARYVPDLPFDAPCS
jgi:WD40 repeat protein/transcriptional regulator with XRE-family HTH domain